MSKIWNEIQRNDDAGPLAAAHVERLARIFDRVARLAGH